MSSKRRSDGTCQANNACSKRGKEDSSTCMLKFYDNLKMKMSFVVNRLEVNCNATTTINHINRIKYYLKRFVMDNQCQANIYSVDRNIKREKCEDFKFFIIKVIRDCFHSPDCNNTSIEIFVYNNGKQSGVYIKKENNRISRKHVIKKDNIFINNGFCEVCEKKQRYIGNFENNRITGLTRMDLFDEKTEKFTHRIYSNYTNGLFSGLGSDIFFREATLCTTGEFYNGKRDGLHFEVSPGKYKYLSIVNKESTGFSLIYDGKKLYELECDNIQSKEKEVDIIMSDGSTYHGYTCDHKFQKEGFYLDCNYCIVYDGEYDKGLFNGRGKLIDLTMISPTVTKIEPKEYTFKDGRIVSK